MVNAIGVSIYFTGWSFPLVRLMFDVRKLRIIAYIRNGHSILKQKAITLNSSVLWVRVAEYLVQNLYRSYYLVCSRLKYLE